MYEVNYSRKQDFIPPFFYSLLRRNNKICLPLVDLQVWQAASNSILQGTELRNMIQKEANLLEKFQGGKKVFFFFFQKRFKLPFNKALLEKLPGDTLTQSHPGSKTYSQGHSWGISGMGRENLLVLILGFVIDPRPQFLGAFCWYL